MGLLLLLLPGTCVDALLAVSEECKQCLVILEPVGDSFIGRHVLEQRKRMSHVLQLDRRGTKRLAVIVGLETAFD